jgi:hypothetical protein
MLVACRLAGLSALEGHYADDNAQAQSGVEEQQERHASSTVLGACGAGGQNRWLTARSKKAAGSPRRPSGPAQSFDVALHRGMNLSPVDVEDAHGQCLAKRKKDGA